MSETSLAVIGVLATVTQGAVFFILNDLRSRVVRIEDRLIKGGKPA